MFRYRFLSIEIHFKFVLNIYLFFLTKNIFIFFIFIVTT